MKKLSLFLTFLLLCQGFLLPAQKSVKVSIDVVGGQVVVGDLLSVSEDSLVVISDFKTNMIIPVSKIISISYSKRKGNFLTGAMTGFVLGASVGLVNPESGFFKKSITIGIPLGLLLGVIISGPKKERKFKLFGKTSAEKEVILMKLRKMALIK